MRKDAGKNHEKAVVAANDGFACKAGAGKRGGKKWDESHYLSEGKVKLMERVGIYNRCSTEEESQRNALAAQAMESREIAEKKGWEIAGQYIESETGTVAYKRSEYQRLLEDMEKGKFDLVMIKSIDRLTRSARDWYFFLSRLNENRLKLYIYIEGKFYTPDDNLITGIKAILAEDFSRELSKKIKNAHKRRQEKKSGCNITCEMFGWDKKGRDTYEINEKEAEYYRTAFLLAREGKGFYTISNMLYEMGARGKKGQKISEVQWRNMLYAPRAHGTVILNKRIYNFDAKKYEKVPESGWIFMENALPPIVSKEYQEEVVEILKKRAMCHSFGFSGKRTDRGEGVCRDGKKEREGSLKAGKYELSGKLVCGRCGSVYYRTGSMGKDTSAVWKCAAFLSGGRIREEKDHGGCDNIHLVETEAMEAVNEAVKPYFENVFGGCGDLDCDIRKVIEKMLKEKNSDKKYEKLWKEYGKLTTKKDMLVNKLLNHVIDDKDFTKYHEDIKEKMEQLEMKINVIKQERLQYNNIEMRLDGIMDVVRKEKMADQAKLKELVKFIDHILVHKDGRLEIIFDKDKLGLEKILKVEAEYIHADGCRKRREAHKRQILELLDGQPKLRLKDISTIMAMSASYVSARVKELKEEGKLEYVRNKGAGAWRTTIPKHR